MSKTWSPPVKIKWQGKARDYFQARKVMPRHEKDDDDTVAKLCLDVLGRQSTQIIMRNKEEAKAMYKLLDKTHWQKKSMNDATARVRKELYQEIYERGWVDNE